MTQPVVTNRPDLRVGRRVLPNAEDTVAETSQTRSAGERPY